MVFERGGFRPNEGHIHVCERPSHRPQYRRPALVHLTEEKKETKQKKKKRSPSVSKPDLQAVKRLTN